jgi:hypothetical protein
MRRINLMNGSIANIGTPEGIIKGYEICRGY